MAKKRLQKTEPLNSPGRFAYEGLERVLHEKARLGIVTSLVANDSLLSFNDLKELCSLSDGNLSRHLEVLRKAGFISTERTGAGRSAKSICKLTKSGQEAFARYIAELEQVVQDAAKNQTLRNSAAKNVSALGTN